jgi:hypothetical protein
MNESQVLSDCSRLDSLRQRLLDTASFLRGIAAIVESLNKGAADQMQVAIHAVQAVGDDLAVPVDEYPDVQAAVDKDSTHPAKPAKAVTLTQNVNLTIGHEEVRIQLQDVTNRLIELLAARQVGRGGQASMKTAIRELKAVGASLAGGVSDAYVRPVDSGRHYDNGHAARSEMHPALNGGPSA